MTPKLYELWPRRLWTRGRTNNLSDDDRRWIVGQGVGLVVTVCPRPDPGWEGHTAYWHRPMADGMKIHIGVEALADEIAETGQPTLIHCNAGRNRSPFLAGLVMTRLGVSGEDAFQRIIRTRPGSLANPLFAAYLRQAPKVTPIPAGTGDCIAGGLR